MRKDVGGVGCGDFVGSVYAGCVDYEIKRREVGVRYRGVLGIWIVYYCI